MSTYPTMNIITSNPDYSDYRPAVGSAGSVVIFERTPMAAGSPTLLYVVDDLSNPDPQPFISSDGPGQQTRADWCWQTNQIAFNGVHQTVWTMNGDGSSPAKIDGTAQFNYPAWSQDGSSLTVMNASDGATPQPSTSQMNTSGTITYQNLNGNDADGNVLFGGMPAVNPNNSLLVAFAGQPNIAAWPPPNPPSKSGYNQSANYIFLNTQSGSTFSSSPLESAAPIDNYDRSYQGRAPAWSPDGRYVVFESNRNGGYAIFLFDTQNPNNAPVQLTEGSYGSQHAKFFPDGKKLILCAFQTPGSGKPPFGIAWIDISTYVA